MDISWCGMEEHATGKPLAQAVDAAMEQLQRGGILAVISGNYCPQFLTIPRKQEVFGALCRPAAPICDNAVNTGLLVLWQSGFLPGNQEGFLF